ncbi:MAG: hypothetical protein R3E13_00440 [Alphaproteobacteria bacterium]
MDVEFLDNRMVEAARKGEIDLVKNYPCGLNCPGCFSEAPVFGDRKRLMKWQEVFEVIDDAREIGLTSIKFLGPGELFNNQDLFNILDACEERGLGISVFTKGAEMGDDNLAKKHYGHLGINTAKELVERLSAYKTLRILLGFNSFDADRQNRMVGSFNKATNYEIEGLTFKNRGVVNYTQKRDAALKNLTDAGFNDPKHGQRLTLVATPLRVDQLDEIADMYVWAARRNIPLITAPTMESGEKSLKLAKSNSSKDPNHEAVTDMYTAIYQRAIDEGIMTREQIRQQGISSYPGTAPCNQVANGLFLRLNGQVQMCPGRSSDDAIYGNTHNTPIAQIWTESWNYGQGPKMNNWCPAKKQGMPPEIIGKIKEGLGL